MKAVTVASILEKEVFARFGIPEQIHSDQGSNFMSKLFHEVCDLVNTKKTCTPACNPKSNPVERTHQDLNSILRAIGTELDQDWEELLPAALMALRTARNRHTGVMPAYALALYGREFRLPVDFISKFPGASKNYVFPYQKCV